MSLSLLLLFIFARYCSSFPNGKFDDIFEFTNDYFTAAKSHCIIVLKTSSNRTENSQLEKLSFKIARQVSQVTVCTLTAYSLQLREPKKRVCGTCFKPLHLIFVEENTKELIRELSYAYQFNKSIWLFFMNKSLTNFFKDVNIQFHAGVYIATPQELGGIQVTEFYNTVPGRFRTNDVSYWDSSHGLRHSNLSRCRRRNNLDGLNLRIGIIEDWPWTSFSGGKAGKGQDIDGFFADVWYELQFRMNFTSTFFIAVDNLTGTLENGGTWTGLLGMLQRREIDVILTRLDINTMRLEITQPLMPILNSRFQVFFKEQGFLLDWMALFRPFSKMTWLVILLWIVALTSALTIFGKLCLYYGLKEHSDYNLPYFLFFVLQSVCFQGTHRVPKVWAVRLLFFLCYLTAAVLIPSYSAALISSLAKRSPVRPFDSLEDLLKKNSYYVMFAGGNAYEYFMGHENSLTHRKVYMDLVKPIQKLHKELGNAVNSLQYVCDHNNFVYLSTESGVEELFRKRKYCNLLKFSKPLSKIHQSIALAKYSPLLDLFNYNILRMQEIGLVNREYYKYLPRIDRSLPREFPPVAMIDVMEAFIFIGAAFAVSLVLLLLERINNKMNAFKKSSKQKINSSFNELQFNDNK